MYMQEFLNSIDIFITNVLSSLGVYGPLLGCVLIIIESMLPVLPLSVFITLNFYAFGNLVGFLISYVLTLVGCNLAFILCKKVLSKRFDHLVKKFDRNKALKLVDDFSSIKFKHLVLLLAFPFTPAFLINIFSGVSNMSHKKFLAATVIAKPFMVYFWGYVGVTLIDSLTHPAYFIKVAVMLLVAYVVSMVINKKFGLD